MAHRTSGQERHLHKLLRRGAAARAVAHVDVGRLGAVEHNSLRGQGRSSMQEKRIQRSLSLRRRDLSRVRVEGHLLDLLPRSLDVPGREVQ
jgi:hypothetical protein